MTNLFGLNNPDQQKLDAWCACTVAPGYDPGVWRYDAHGNVICYANYGDRSSDYGWELDHIIPSALGGLGGSHNIRALHWRANASHGGALSAALRMTGKR